MHLLGTDWLPWPPSVCVFMLICKCAACPSPWLWKHMHGIRNLLLILSLKGVQLSSLERPSLSPVECAELQTWRARTGRASQKIRILLVPQL